MTLRGFGLVISICALALALAAGGASAGPIDSDWDGIVDENDNCPKDFNPLQENDDNDNWGDACDNCLGADNTVGGVPVDQCDTDQDGYGNFCDADVNNDDQVGISDFNLLRTAFGNPAAPFFAEIDCNCDGVVAIADFNCLRSQFGNPPGPSGRECAGSQPLATGYCPSAAEVAH